MNNRKTVDYVELRNGVYKGVEIVKNNGDPRPALKLDCEYRFCTGLGFLITF